MSASNFPRCIFVKLVFVALSIVFANTRVGAAEPESGIMEMMPGHDHSSMDHAGMMSHEPKPETKAMKHTGHSPKQDLTQSTTKRDPHAYTDGLDFSGLSKPIMGDGHTLGALIVDRLEGVRARDDFSMTYDWQAWFGGDYNRLIVRAEGEIDQGTFKSARNELLWGHALTAYWDTQVGVRYDSGLGADRAWGAFGIQGFAPYWIYIEATAYIGEQGRAAFRLESEYDLLITQKLILQPRLEVNFYSQSDPSRLISSGLSNIEAGLRLRYEFKREFAPYIGIEWANTFGSAADAIRAQGKKAEETRFIVGVHFWF
uniref:copper resistance protein B n=1 Tax=Crenothrix polyspora TaxID=360316 RepID=UPI00211AC9F1|nr:copper resistance protein B [Crenothrix polyspora]